MASAASVALCPFHRTADPAGVTPGIGEQISRVLAGVQAEWPIQSPLTAGLDSRLLLACSRDLIDGITFYTANLNGEDGWQDIIAARHLAARFGLRYREDRSRRARRQDLQSWVISTGGETGEVRGWRNCRTLAQQEAGKATVTGYVGELARAYWWIGMTPDSVLTPESIVARCRVPARPEFVDRAAHWLAGLPPMDAISTTEILYLEQRGGCWAGVLEYGELGPTPARLAPMNQAFMIRAMLRLPDEYRRRAGLHYDLIGRYWPELLEFPFNQAVRVNGVRGRFYRVRRALRDEASRVRRVARRGRSDPRWLLERIRSKLFAR